MSGDNYQSSHNNTIYESVRYDITIDYQKLLIELIDYM